jgi:Fuc2NAc and GlcNAc transferase
MARTLKSHKKVTLGILGINMLWLFPLSVISSMAPDFSLYCLVIAYLPLLLTVLKVGAGTTNA